MSPQLVVSVINYRTPSLTISCVQSVLEAAGDIALSVVIIDNASEDGSVATLRAWIDAQDAPVPVQLMPSAVNLGFAGGHNAVMRAYPASFYLLLNSDALVRSDALMRLLAAADAHPDAGLLAPALEGKDGTRQISCFRSHSPASELIRGAATGPITRILKRYDVPLGPNPQPADIGWVSFACVLIRHVAFTRTGGLDDGFFLYYEDAEFSRRVRQDGWRIYYVPDAKVVHFRGGSGPVKALSRAAKRLPRYYYRSRTRYFRKIYGQPGLLAANLCWIAGRTVAAARWLAGKPVPQAHAHEWRDIWTGFLHPLHRPTLEE